MKFDRMYDTIEYTWYWIDDSKIEVCLYLDQDPIEFEDFSTLRKQNYPLIRTKNYQDGGQDIFAMYSKLTFERACPQNVIEDLIDGINELRMKRYYGQE